MRKVIIYMAGLVAVVLVLWGVLHVMISPVNPEQERPDGHFGGSCGMCHIVSEGAELVE